jgi:hypothetical protein
VLNEEFAWARDLPHVAAAIAHLDFVVNYHLRGRFLPLDLWCAGRPGIAVSPKQHVARGWGAVATTLAKTTAALP